MSFSQDKHDIGILRQASTATVGFILARDAKGVPIYQSWDDQYLAEQKTESPGYDSLPMEKEFAIVADDWRSGYGKFTYDENDPKRYFASYNMDLRWEGMAICGPAATTVTLPTTTDPTIADGELDDWTNNTLNEWSKTGDCSLTKEEGEVHSGTCSANIGCAASSSLYLKQSLATTQIQNRRFTATAYCKSSVIGKSLIRINDGGTTYSGSANTGSSWEQLSVSATLPAAASALAIELVTVGSVTAYWDLVDISRATVGQALVFMDFNSELYAALGGLLAKANTAGDEFEAVYELANPITDMEKFTDDNLYLLCGTAANYQYCSTADVCSTTDSQAQLMCAVGDTMWKAVLPNEIYSATDPTADANWSSPATTIGGTDHDILELFTDGATLYIKKADRTFYIDSSGNPQVLIEETKHLATDTTLKDNALVWQGKAYVGCGASSLVEYDDGDISWRSPDKYCTNLGDFDGKIQALASDEEWLFAIVDNTSTTEVLAGRTETINGTTSWVWHPIARISLAGSCQTAYVSSVVQKRLWIGSASTADSLYYIPLYASYGDVTNDANKSFQTDGWFETPWLHANFKGDSKAFTKITLTTAEASTAQYFEGHYKKKGDTLWTDIGDFQTSPTTTKYLPAATSDSSKPVSNMMKFKFLAKTASTATTPILYSYDVRGILYPTKRELIYCEVRCADEITLNDGTRERDNDAALIKEALEEAKDDATWPVEFYDFPASPKADPATIYVRFLPTKPFSYITKDETSGNIERRFRLLLQKVALSA